MKLPVPSKALIANRWKCSLGFVRYHKPLAAKIKNDLFRGQSRKLIPRPESQSWIKS
jgi:hypothetical protein